MIMDEIFGADNFVASFLWRKKGTSTNVKGASVSAIADYQLAYRKTSDGAIKQRTKSKSTRKYPHVDEIGAYRTEGMEKKDVGIYRRDTMKFKILGQVPREGKRWQIGESIAKQLEKAGKLFVDENGIVKRKIYDFEDRDTKSANPTYLPESRGSSDSANKVLISILENADFENPKPVELIKHLIQLTCDSNDIILDSFAGSGATAHAVLDLNKEDGGDRKFILVECEDYADKITAERVRRVIKGVPTAEDANLRDGLGGEFGYWTLGDEISIASLLDGKLPSYEDLARYLFYTATGEHCDAAKIDRAANYIGESRAYYVYLLYEPDRANLKNIALTLECAKYIADHRPADKPRVVFAPARYAAPAELDALKIKFAQIPFQIHRLPN